MSGILASIIGIGQRRVYASGLTASSTLSGAGTTNEQWNHDSSLFRFEALGSGALSPSYLVLNGSLSPAFRWRCVKVSETGSGSSVAGGSWSGEGWSVPSSSESITSGTTVINTYTSVFRIDGSYDEGATSFTILTITTTTTRLS